MTRRIAGPSQTTKTTSPYVLPIGHLSTKSSVYSPVSMSRMSQDLVFNHMKSHYKRISSAKACVDTSVPKCMKLTIKEKDRKRKEALLASNLQRTSSRSSSRQSNHHTEVSDSPRGWDNTNDKTNVFPQHRNSIPSRSPRTSPQTLTENSNLKETRHKHRLKEPASQISYNKKEDSRDDDSLKHLMNSDQYDYERFERRKTDLISRRTEPNTADKNNFYVNGDSVRPKSEYDDDSHGRTNNASDGTTNFRNSSSKQTNKNTGETSELGVTDMSHLYASFQHEEYDLGNTSLENGLKEHRTTNRLYTSTPRCGREEEFEVGLPTMTFSYKSPPMRKSKQKNPEEMIWTEEQKYLQFISDVTSDVLGRGICSNRVINKVFESHIEKRKEDLDEVIVIT